MISAMAKAVALTSMRFYMKEIIDTKRVSHLFDDWKETMILSAMQSVMGSIYGNEDSAVAAAVDFCFYSGKPNGDLIRFWPPECKRALRLLVPKDKAWEETIEDTLGGSVKKVTRYALQKTSENFDRNHLKTLAAALPKGYTLRHFDKEIYDQIIADGWGHTLVASYDDYDHFASKGWGVAVMHGDEMAAGISSYCTFDGGYEVEINTHLDHRRKGLGLACAAQFILDCLERGLYPGWDAANEGSLRMAQKLGYLFDREYVAYIQYR